MTKLTIDNRTVEAPEGSTILEAARLLGIDIPTMCRVEGIPPRTSCMVCVVKVQGMARMVPACATVIREGMVVRSEFAEVHHARRINLELMLGDHTGDCEAPCQSACPAGLFVPRMLRLFARGRTTDALSTVYEAFPFAGTLGHICPAPCERACRRGQHDQPISIRRLHGFLAEKVSAESRRQLLTTDQPTGASVAVVGAGPCGLSTAFHLALAGHSATVMDDHHRPGGALRYAIDRDTLPEEVLDGDVQTVLDAGVTFVPEKKLGHNVSLTDLQNDFDAVMLAPGKLTDDRLPEIGLDPQLLRHVGAGAHACLVERPGVFAWMERSDARPMAVRAAAGGRFAARAIDAWLRGEQVDDGPARFSVHIGKVTDDQMQAFLREASSHVARNDQKDMTPGRAGSEAGRCLHCDCRKPESCKLRLYGRQYGARIGRLRGARPPFVQDRSHPDIVYEPGKCISCGVCTAISQSTGEPLGLAMNGRGLTARPAVPFDGMLDDGLTSTALRCVEACPTGALAMRYPADE